MTRLNWNSVGEKFFEVGIDKAALYVGDDPGVPWNGLISVSESPSGGAPVPYYLDGFKYLHISSAEEFEADITAYSAPMSFAQCDGTQAIANGLFVTQQPRKQFGFAYRTLVGNDTEGLDHGYKIHIVYNALAGPAQRQNKSLGASVEPSTFSWHISTMPPIISGFKPSAHLIVDSRYTAPSLMSDIEDILYGSDSSTPRLPTPVEIKAMYDEANALDIFDLGGGEYAAEGTAVEDLGAGEFAIDHDTVVNNGDGTFTVL